MPSESLSDGIGDESLNQRCEQFFKRFFKLFQTVFLQTCRQGFDIDAERGGFGELSLCFVRAFGQRSFGCAVVDEGFERGIGNGVDGVRADQAVNVECVRIGRVFTPVDAHKAARGLRLGFPVRQIPGAEVLCPVLVGGFGKGDGDFAFEVVRQCCVQRAVHREMKKLATTWIWATLCPAAKRLAMPRA